MGSLLAWGAYATPTFPLEQLTPALRGYGLTAGPGNALERFEVEVLALQQDLGVGFPLVLVRTGGELIEAAGGVAAGMSGSPVYLPLDGVDALLGAISFTFLNSDGYLALVTPIEVMRRAAPAGTLREFGAEHLPDAPLVPVRTPLLMAGLSQRALKPLSPLFEGTQLVPITSHVGLGERDEAHFALEPGSAVSVQLLRGDITVAAIGTLTLVDEGSFYAFGHPLLGQGEVSFALAPAFVSHIVPHRAMPFKLADSGQRLLGTVTQDRPFAVSGLLESEPAFIPVTLRLHHDGPSLVKRFEITADERYYAPLLAAATLRAVDEANARLAAGTAELAWAITLRGGEVLRLLEQTSDPSDIATATARLAAEPLAILADNAFADPEVTAVELSVQLESAQRVAEIVEVVAENDPVRPGDTLVAYVRLQPYRDEPEVKTVRVPLPAFDGELELTFRGGLERGEGPGESELPILSFAELLVALREHVQASELVVETYLDGELTRLARLPQPYLVRGSKSLTISTGGASPAAPGQGDDAAKEAPIDPDVPFEAPPFDRDPRP